MICFLLFLAQICITSRHFYINADDISSPEYRGQELLLCRKCGADVADSNYLFSKLSPGARKTEKQNIFGKQNVTVQTLVNPFGVKFDIVTTEKARCDNVGLVSVQNQNSFIITGADPALKKCCGCDHNLLMINIVNSYKRDVYKIYDAMTKILFSV